MCQFLYFFLLIGLHLVLDDFLMLQFTGAYCDVKVLLLS